MLFVSPLVSNGSTPSREFHMSLGSESEFLTNFDDDSFHNRPPPQMVLVESCRVKLKKRRAAQVLIAFVLRCPVDSERTITTKAFLVCSAASEPNGPGREDARAAVRRTQPLFPAAAGASRRARTPAGRLLPWSRLRSSRSSEVSNGDAESDPWGYGQHAVRTTGG